MVQPALSPTYVQFYNSPLHGHDWSETISDACLIFFRLGLGGFAEVTEPDSPGNLTPATKAYVLQYYRDFVGEIGGFLLFFVAITFWLPFTLLGLYLVTCSVSHQSNWNDWKAADRIALLKHQLDFNILDQKLVLAVVNEESLEIFSWMANRISGTVKERDKNEIVISALVASSEGDTCLSALSLSDEAFEGLIRHCLKNGDTAELLAQTMVLSISRRRDVIKGVFDADGHLKEPHQKLLDYWNRVGLDKVLTAEAFTL